MLHKFGRRNIFHDLFQDLGLQELADENPFSDDEEEEKPDRAGQDDQEKGPLGQYYKELKAQGLTNDQ